MRICSCLRSIWLTKCFTNKLYMGITLSLLKCKTIIFIAESQETDEIWFNTAWL